MTKKKIQDMDGAEFLSLMKELQVEHLEPQFRAMVQEEFQKERANFWVPAERHYKEHLLLEKCAASMEDKEANHEFVSTVRTGVGYAGKISFGIAISALVVFIGGAIWMAIVAAVKAAKGGG